MTMSIIRDGQVVTRLTFASGGEQAATKAEEAFYARGGFPGQGAVHTEARALYTNAIEPGDKVIMEGSLESCKMCKSKLSIAAQRLGATIEYRYPNENGKIVPWLAKSPVTRAVMLKAAARGALSSPKTRSLLKIIFKGALDDTLGTMLGVFDWIPRNMYNRSLQRTIWESNHPGQKYYQAGGGC